MTNQLVNDLSIMFVMFAILFYQLSHTEPNTVSTLLLLTVWAIGVAYFIYTRYVKNETQINSSITKLNKDYKERKEANTSNYYVKQFSPKGLVYLQKNPELLVIVNDLFFCRVYDKPRFQDLLLYMDKFQKVYIYITAGRYDFKSYSTIFYDLRENILETLYSFYFVVPRTLKNIFGVNPHELIQDNISKFFILSKRMIEVIGTYTKSKNYPYYIEFNPSPSDRVFDSIKQRTLP